MKTNAIMPWNERAEVKWLCYTAQPPLGLIKGSYYHAERRFGVTEWSVGHRGELTVVKDDSGRLAFAEFNETTMEGYYNRYFDHVSKRRSDYAIWQASSPRAANAGVVLVDGMLHVERQILERQSLDGDFDLLTGASNSMRGLLPLVAEVAAEMKFPASKRYYGAAEDFGYGLTGWLQVVVEDGKIVSCFYDEIFADTQDAIYYPELKRYYRQSKYFSPCFEEPNAPSWNNHAFFIGFHKPMDLLNQRVVERQDLLDIGGLKHTDGLDVGPIWDRKTEDERPLPPLVFGKTNLRYPVWDNYLGLAKQIAVEIARDGTLTHGA